MIKNKDINEIVYSSYLKLAEDMVKSIDSSVGDYNFGLTAAIVDADYTKELTEILISEFEYEIGSIEFCSARPDGYVDPYIVIIDEEGFITVEKAVNDGIKNEYYADTLFIHEDVNSGFISKNLNDEADVFAFSFEWETLDDECMSECDCDKCNGHCGDCDNNGDIMVAIDKDTNKLKGFTVEKKTENGYYSIAFFSDEEDKVIDAINKYKHM